MASLFNFIAQLLGSLLYFLYNNIWFNYGVAICTLTIILRFLLLPLAMKSFKSMAQMSKIQPLMNEIQRKYKNDKETLNKEIMKVYQEKKINPFGGCLPLIIQIPILYALFLVISHPITYMFSSPEILNTNSYYKNVSTRNYYQQVEFLEKVQKDSSILEDVKKELNNKYKNKNISSNIDKKNIKKMNLYFLGFNMGDVPKLVPSGKEVQKYLILLIIPILTGLTTYLSSKYGQPPVNQTEQTEMQKTMQMQMFIMMPLMTMFFSFQVPVGLSVYWIVSNIFQLVQQRILIDIFYKKKEA